MNVTTGLDLAKRVFQVHWVEPETGELRRKALMRGEVAPFFFPPGARGSDDGVLRLGALLGRELSRLCHEVRLMAAQFVRPFVKTNKTDAADAEAIWGAAQPPGMQFVAFKSERSAHCATGLKRLTA